MLDPLHPAAPSGTPRPSGIQTPAHGMISAHCPFSCCSAQPPTPVTASATSRASAWQLQLLLTMKTPSAVCASKQIMQTTCCRATHATQATTHTAWACLLYQLALLQPGCIVVVEAPQPLYVDDKQPTSARLSSATASSALVTSHWQTVVLSGTSTHYTPRHQSETACACTVVHPPHQQLKRLHWEVMRQNLRLERRAGGPKPEAAGPDIRHMQALFNPTQPAQPAWLQCGQQTPSPSGQCTVWRRT